MQRFVFISVDERKTLITRSFAKIKKSSIGEQTSNAGMEVRVMQTPRCCSSMMSRSPLIVPTGSSSSSYQLFIVGGNLAGSIGNLLQAGAYVFAVRALY